tara:strand:+ start:1951 stop:2265 length:315 start_codon:yes stop_codon:yes gene_type:complete
MTEKKDGRDSIWPMPDEDWKQVHEHTTKVEEADRAQNILTQTIYQQNPESNRIDRMDAADLIYDSGCDVQAATEMIRQGYSLEDIIDRLGNTEIARSREIPQLG